MQKMREEIQPQTLKGREWENNIKVDIKKYKMI
jgi:hypothetical protein